MVKSLREERAFAALNEIQETPPNEWELPAPSAPSPAAAGIAPALPSAAAPAVAVAAPSKAQDSDSDEEGGGSEILNGM